MSKAITEISGFAELKVKIQRLANDKDKKKEVLMILRQVAKPTLDAARSNVPVSKKTHKARGKNIVPGNLKKSLGMITSKAENPTILVGARAKGSNDGWYAHFVHNGVNIYRKGFKRKRIRGANMKAALKRTKGNPFLKTAYEQTNGKVTADAEKRIERFIQRRINKLG